MSKFVKLFDLVNSKYYFSSDQHLGHGNIIRFCNRPFISLHEMNCTIIDNINSIVRPTDHFIIAGDFAFGNPVQYLPKINCNNIYFITGSHDKQLSYSLSPKIKQIADTMNIELNGQHIVISHCPHLCWERSHYGSWHLFGHIHSKNIVKTTEPTLFDKVIAHGKMLDIGVDGHAFMPWNFEQLSEVLNNKLGFLLQARRN